MKRHMKLIRIVLEHFECHGSAEFIPPLLETPDYTCAQVDYHMSLCVRAGYLSELRGTPSLLTWEGHEALDRLRKL